MSSSPSIEVGAPRSLSHSVCCCEIGEVWIEDNTDNQSSAPEPPSVFAGPEETKPSGYLGLGCRVGKAISRSMVTILEKSRRRLPKGALSFVSDLSFGLQLIALTTGMALAWLVANAARDTFAALVAAYQNSAPGDWLTSTALVTTVWVLAFAGSVLLFKWGLSRALKMVVLPLARRRRFQSEAYFGPGLKSQPRLDS